MQDKYKYKYRFSFQHLVSHQCLLIWEFTARPTSQEDRLLITGALQKMIFTTGRPEPTGNLCRTNCPKCFPTEEVLRGRWRRLLSPSWQQLKPVRLASGTFDFIHLNHLAARAESDFIHLNHDLLPSNIPVSAWVCMSSASARQHLWTRDTTFGTDLTSYSHCWNQQTNNKTQKQSAFSALTWCKLFFGLFVFWSLVQISFWSNVWKVSSLTSLTLTTYFQWKRKYWHKILIFSEWCAGVAMVLAAQGTRSWRASSVTSWQVTTFEENQKKLY